MTTYRIKLFDDHREPTRELILEYATDNAALDDLGMIDHYGPVEVWQDTRIVGRFVAAGGPAD